MRCASGSPALHCIHEAIATPCDTLVAGFLTGAIMVIGREAKSANATVCRGLVRNVGAARCATVSTPSAMPHRAALGTAHSGAPHGQRRGTRSGEPLTLW